MMQHSGLGHRWSKRRVIINIVFMADFGACYCFVNLMKVDSAIFVFCKSELDFWFFIHKGIYFGEGTFWEKTF